MAPVAWLLFGLLGGRVMRQEDLHGPALSCNALRFGPKAWPETQAGVAFATHRGLEAAADGRLPGLRLTAGASLLRQRS